MELSDAALLEAERAMRIQAWLAPKALGGDMHNPTIMPGCDAHARWGAEWAELHRECRRRGLSPSTDDPTFRPQTRNDG